MNGKNKTDLIKYDAVALDYRVTQIRYATPEESNGEAGWVMVHLAPDFTHEGSDRFLTCGVRDAKRILKSI